MKWLEPVLYAQVENALELGWRRKEIMLVANFGWKWNGVKAIRVELNRTCLTGSKMFALEAVRALGWFGETVWAHDLDVWQNAPFEEPEFKDVGICRYSNSRFNGGSVFWKPSAKDLVDGILQALANGAPREEPTLNRILKDKKNSKRVTVLNETFNVGCSGFVPRFLRAEKPVVACHLNPYNGIAWETHRLNRNGLGFVSVSDRLEVILRQHFPRLATEISASGLKRSAELREMHMVRSADLMTGAQ